MEGSLSLNPCLEKAFKTKNKQTEKQKQQQQKKHT